MAVAAFAEDIADEAEADADAIAAAADSVADAIAEEAEAETAAEAATTSAEDRADKALSSPWKLAETEAMADAALLVSAELTEDATGPRVVTAGFAGGAGAGGAAAASAGPGTTPPWRLRNMNSDSGSVVEE